MDTDIVQLSHPTSSRKPVGFFDYGDPFDDLEDTVYDLQFSRDVIRKEMARRVSADDDDDEYNGHGHGGHSPHDTSVSSLDINGDDTQSVPSSRSSSPDSEPPKFESITLSRSTSGQGDDDRPEEGNEAEFNAEDDKVVRTPSPSPQPEEYPSVIIDASQSAGHRVTLSTDSRMSHNTASGSSRHSEDQYQEAALPAVVSAQPDSPQVTLSQTSSRAPSPTHRAIQSMAVSLSNENLPPLPISPTKHQYSRSLGPSVLEKVISKTRPTFLPPKPKQEDNKHLADWQDIMRQSRLAADKRRKALQDRRLLREKKVEETLHIWEKEILPDWRVVNKNPRLRKLWWKGVPTKLRPALWERAVGNPLALNKDSFRMCLSRAKRALASGTFPSAEVIDDDVATTLPSLHLFLPERGPMHADLKELLYAWVVSRSDEGLGYQRGAARIAAMLLINLPIQKAFVVMRNLLERHCMRSFFGGDASSADVDAYYRIFDTLLADAMPKIYFNFKQHHISPASYLPDWLLPLFLDHLPFEACARLWDVFILEGDSFLYRASLAILAVLEPRLFFPDKQELLELLRGENKAAIDVAIREGNSLDGGKYEIYGVNEESIWERIDAMEDWWRDSTWTRLIQRELPDL